MQSKTVKSLVSKDGKRRALVVERRDGAFQCVEEYWRRSEVDGEVLWEGWVELGTLDSICATVEIAEREARARFHWLRD